MRPGLAHDALSRELARRLGLDGRPFAWPAGAMEHGWELAAEHATLQWLRSQLERSERQQVERLQRHGGEGGGGEGGGGEGGGGEGAMLPVRLSRPASTQHVAERIQENDAATKALREEIAAFNAEVYRADENPTKAKKKRGPEAEPRSKTEMSSEAGECER